MCGGVRPRGGPRGLRALFFALMVTPLLVAGAASASMQPPGHCVDRVSGGDACNGVSWDPEGTVGSLGVDQETEQVAETAEHASTSPVDPHEAEQGGLVPGEFAVDLPAPYGPDDDPPNVCGGMMPAPVAGLLVSVIERRPIYTHGIPLADCEPYEKGDPADWCPYGLCDRDRPALDGEKALDPDAADPARRDEPVPVAPTAATETAPVHSHPLAGGGTSDGGPGGDGGMTATPPGDALRPSGGATGPAADTTDTVLWMAAAAVPLVAWAAAKLALWLFSRIPPHRLLEHPARARIVAVVEAEPGIHHRKIQRRMGLGDGALSHHLEKLVQGGLLVRQNGRGFSCYFKVGAIDRMEMAALPAVKSDKARAIVAAVAKRPGVAPFEVADALGMGRPHVAYYLKELQAKGVIDVQRDGRIRRLRLTATGRGVLERFDTGA